MVVDSEEHRNTLLQLIDAAPFAGASAELVVELKTALRTATLTPQPDEEVIKPGGER